MQRDMDLVRKLLLWMESQEHGLNINWKIEIEGYTNEQIGYHAYLMDQAGLISANSTTYMESTSPSAMPMCLTWAGHDFLGSVRDDTIWAKVKTEVLRPAAGASFPVLIEWLKDKALTGLGVS